ncbi:MAG TPA: mechanosensitive ion channel domain-containing protein [Patescibacteria group bacterium]|nr:mechanosensitive ion channel domain-containing protein [Patescibacteria group bacterium]
MAPFISLSLSFVNEHWKDALGIVCLVAVGKIALAAACRRIVASADDGDPSRESGKEKRARTLAGVVRTTGNAVIAVIAGVMLLRLFGVDTVPLLAGAGVIGVAIGVSVQNLIKDFVAGMYIVAENQYAVGDRVKIGEHEGTVHALHLRMTVLRTDGGDLVFITNGSITSVVNHSLGESLKDKAAAAAPPAPEAPAAQPPPPADVPAAPSAVPPPQGGTPAEDAPAPEPAHDEKTAP